jgi:hypothetical protein
MVCRISSAGKLWWLWSQVKVCVLHYLTRLESVWVNRGIAPCSRNLGPG